MTPSGVPVSLAGAKGMLILESVPEDREGNPGDRCPETKPGDRCTAIVSPMLSTRVAADYVGLGVNQFRDLVSAGRIVKRGSTSRRPFHVEDLDEYLDTLR